MPLCKTCSSLDLVAISQTPVNDLFRLDETVYPDHSLFSYTSRNYQLDPAQSQLTPHYNSLAELGASANSCDLCGLIQHSIDYFLKGFERRERLGFKSSLPDYGLWLGGRDDADGFQILGLKKGHITCRPFYSLLGGIGFCLENGAENHLKSIIRGRKVSPSPTAPAVLQRIQEWIQQSAEDDKPAAKQANRMPTRLLKILDLGREVCLHTSDTGNVTYAALSYSWGDTPPTTLTSQNFHEFEAGLRTEELPQTLQDAIWLAHQLQISFIWIDSLCIIQDDPDDWAQESAKMSHVYGNSFLTIAASRAANSSEGFLGNRVEKPYLPVPFNNQGIPGEVFAFPLHITCVGYPKRGVWIEHEPLTARAWALQERYMSHRTLHFTSSQILFENLQHCLAEDMAANHKLASMSKNMSADHFQNINGKAGLQEWYRLVELYSMRKLTVPDDKLPAISGLAAHFSQYRRLKCASETSSSRYVAGIWSDDFIRGLYWATSYASRPPNNRAPTWSWASLDGRIDYGTEWFEQINELATVNSFHVDLKSQESGFGQILGGWISLKVIKLYPHTKFETDNRKLWFCQDGASFQLGFRWDLESYRAREASDSLAVMVKAMTLLVVPLGWIPNQSQGPDDPNKLLGPLCLVLEAVDNSGLFPSLQTFQRVGTGMMIPCKDGKQGLDKEGLRRLITGEWTTMKQQGMLEDIIII